MFDKKEQYRKYLNVLQKQMTNQSIIQFKNDYIKYYEEHEQEIEKNN